MTPVWQFGSIFYMSHQNFKSISSDEEIFTINSRWKVSFNNSLTEKSAGVLNVFGLPGQLARCVD